MKLDEAHLSLVLRHAKALRAVLKERANQQEKWGDQFHELPIWLAILHEETGELAQAILHEKFGGEKRNNVFKEAVQVAAVALQIVEFLQKESQLNEFK